jgi:predicted N-acyltransferase
MTYRTHASIHELDKNTWNTLFCHGGPCLSHAFLACLEDSQSVGSDSGWQPHHLVWYKNGQLIAAMPGYIKTHSYGEYVFDHGWADAYHRYGLKYYPKWVNAIPFTPVTQQRIGLAADATIAMPQLLEDIQSMLAAHGLSSAHCLYLNANEIAQLNTDSWAQRHSVQFEWGNRGYANFADYLEVLTARRRRSIKKERKNIAKQQVQIVRKFADTLTQADMDFFYQCYQITYLKRSGHHGYLTEAFFEQLFATCPEHILLVIASVDKRPVAASMYLYDDDVLYGRYWGALEDVSGLHFECCYYQGIEFAIEQKIARFNPGTQGEHKILRGFVPTTCHSLHYLAHPQMHAAVQDFVDRERPAIEQYRQECMALLPFNEENR